MNPKSNKLCQLDSLHKEHIIVYDYQGQEKP
jgi:hypothetical protein